MWTTSLIVWCGKISLVTVNLCFECVNIHTAHCHSLKYLPFVMLNVNRLMCQQCLLKYILFVLKWRCTCDRVYPIDASGIVPSYLCVFQFKLVCISCPECSLLKQVFVVVCLSVSLFLVVTVWVIKHQNWQEGSKALISAKILTLPEETVQLWSVSVYTR